LRHLASYVFVTLLFTANSCKATGHKISAAPEPYEATLAWAGCYAVSGHNGAKDYWLENAQTICVTIDETPPSTARFVFFQSSRILETLQGGRKLCQGCLAVDSQKFDILLKNDDTAQEGRHLTLISSGSDEKHLFQLVKANTSQE
jgi:hypothetical protein